MIGCFCACVPRLALRLQCSVCRQAINDEDVRSGEVCGIMFGFMKYAICCCCHQEVPDTKDRNYRARWRRWYRKLTAGQDTHTGEDAKILKGR